MAFSSDDETQTDVDDEDNQTENSFPIENIIIKKKKKIINVKGDRASFSFVK